MVGEGERTPRRPPAPASGPVSAEENDIAPEGAVTRMVHEERQESSGKKDLLDASRPQE
jgi:hypothetical protein